jgi:hypothetical protein
MERQDACFWGAQRHKPGGNQKNPNTGDVERWNNRAWATTSSKSNEFNPAILRTYFPDPAVPTFAMAAPSFAKFTVPRPEKKGWDF